ncbi:hypothetical protein IWZ00DRAFT_368216 [Phyllosticta capitalensis]
MLDGTDVSGGCAQGFWMDRSMGVGFRFFFYLPFFLFLCIDHVPAHATHDVDDFAIDFFHLLSPLHFLFGCLFQLVLAWCRKAMDLGEALVGCWVGWLDGVPSLAMWPAFTSSLGHVS